MDEASSTLIDDAWSVSYLPGEWTLIAAPAALVVLEPAPARAAGMVAEVWRRVLSAGSASQLTQRLSEIGLDAMPTMAVVFRDDAGVHALLRGDVELLGADGEAVGDGNGATPWRGVDVPAGRCRLRLAGPRPDLPVLPLAMGVVRAAEVLVEAAPAVPPAPEMPVAAGEEAPAADDEAALPVEHGEEPRPFIDEVLHPGPVMWDESGEPPADVQQVAHEWGDADAEPATLHDARPHDDGLQPAGSPGDGPEEASSVRLVTSTGQVVDLDRPVVIGRAPTLQGSDPASRLVTVPSPSHDISRTHVRVTPGQNGLEVTDMHSTNGTILVAPDGTAIRLAPGRTAPLPVGGTIDLGDGLTIDVVDFRPV
ncbi:MAG TPA: FHA domain-containing protein [Propionibacteriaceae bacterium]|nr:FHA domain-containing protein [Propionibacteriaceae bacterium]